jgi:hypothetical protein
MRLVLLNKDYDNLFESESLVWQSHINGPKS